MPDLKRIIRHLNKISASVPHNWELRAEFHVVRHRKLIQVNYLGTYKAIQKSSSSVCGMALYDDLQPCRKQKMTTVKGVLSEAASERQKNCGVIESHVIFELWFQLNSKPYVGLHIRSLKFRHYQLINDVNNFPYSLAVILLVWCFVWNLQNWMKCCS
jgi:hypothetical protein